MVQLKWLRGLTVTEFSPTTQSLLILFLLSLPLLLLLIKPRSHGGLNLPPSPPKLPVIGNLHQISPNLPHRSLRALSDKYGPVLLVHFGSLPALVVSSSEIINEIVKEHDAAFADRSNFTSSSTIFYGCRDAVCCPYGEHWRQVRKICVLELLSKKMVRELESVRDEELKKMLGRVRSSSLTRSPIEMREALFDLAFNIILRSACGDLCEDDEVCGQTFKELVAEELTVAGTACFADLVPWLGWMDRVSGFASRLRNIFEKLDWFTERIIDEHVDRAADGTSSKRDFLDILLRLQKDGDLDIDLTRDSIKAIIHSIFVGATDTASALMEWIMAELVKHPNVMKKAQEEIRGVIGDKLKITSSDLDRMSYLKCVIKETMRLHPFGLYFRGTTQAVRLCGYDIPSKTRVMINQWAIQRDGKVWENPDQFFPERFVDSENTDFVGQTGFIPFGFGRRTCPGVSYALAVVENAIANLLCWYDWELPRVAEPESLDMEEKYAAALFRKHPLCLVPVSR